MGVIELGTATGSCHVSSRGASLAVLQTVHIRYNTVSPIHNGRGLGGGDLCDVVSSEDVTYG